MIERVPAAARRPLAIALLVLLVGLVAGTAWLPFWLIGREREELTTLEAEIRSLTARLPLRDQLLAEAEALERSTDLERVLMRGETAAVAAAELQGQLTALAAASGLTVSSVQSVEPTADGPFTRVGLRFTLAGDIVALRDLLYGIETGTPSLVVDELSLSGSEVAADDATATQLQTTVELHGWLVPPPPAPTVGS